MIKAAFFDIDGTLVSFNTHKVSDSSKEAIRILKEKGIKVFIATGRIKNHINNLDNLEFDGYITANGFNCFIGDKEIYKKGIEREEIYSLIDYLKNKEKFPCSVMMNSGIFINYVTKEVEAVSKSINLPIPAVDNYYEFLEKNIDNILQINLFVDEAKEKELMKKIFKNCESSRWHPLFTDVNTKGGGKHIGMDKIIEYYGINISETMAFGDGGNDITMIEHAAIGVAMGNANEGVKEVADYITDDVDNNGIYNALKHFSII
ncbi:Cof-type HAD-IIB family hydrolase [uncultured Brachyspira sp.]|uniref:Cof-type HAD-IIB family hydrolase n=1 Tax=uncultured Brachyspira sp. TaxID=221953 RepID=UPI00260F337D|nr:Cof-type HAD-IIB family hydrolase [uncultured Brachyspira sp.]